MLQNRRKLTKKQLEAIGYKKQEEIPAAYWNQKIDRFFKKYNTRGINKKYLENQTFKDFMEMDLSGPNQQGSGRFKFNKISQIKISVITRKSIKRNLKAENKNSKKQQLHNKKISKQKFYELTEKTSNRDKDLVSTQQCDLSIKAISQLLTSFFQIPVSYNKSINLSIDKTTNNLVDEDQLIQYQVQKKEKKPKQRPKSLQRPTYDVWKLIDIGIEYKNEHMKTKKSVKNNIPKQEIYLFLIEGDLLEQGNEVDGRATGDGVAFISFQRKDFDPINLREQFIQQPFPSYTIPILIHQCLHTLGFDHCSVWECLMNSVTNEEVLLCPCCVRKFESEIHPRIRLKQWYRQIGNTLQEIKTQMKQRYGAEKCIKMFADLLFQKPALFSEKVSGSIEKIKLKLSGSKDLNNCNGLKSISPICMLQKARLILTFL